MKRVIDSHSTTSTRLTAASLLDYCTGNMTFRILLLGLLAVYAALAQNTSPSGPALPYHPVENWAKLPEGWNFGECSGVAVDKQDNVWIFNRGAHPVVEFDTHGNMLRAWKEVPIQSSHGIRVGADGNIWLVDVAGHKVLKMTPDGRVLMAIGGVGDKPGNQNSKDAFNRPTNIAFAPDGSFFVSDGYVNSRVVKYSKDGDYLQQWGQKGKADAEFSLVHDVVFDSQGHLYVADRDNWRILIFDQDGKFLGKWTNVGDPWGLDYFAPENAIYMSDGANDRVVKLNMDGQITGTLGSHGRTPGKFFFPHSIAVDSTGALYVAEIRNWRVQKFVK
ncbi:MAG TPA: peptidyl-alpha-hydroxyglycine alpha-amidating lyase family protein [Bryobacteraceae bacterium]|nr:peptidyl-alpha-hydroxyglycine alpha-amidating lyase family protein [Bryobacteraceae bacterium]